MTGVYRRYKTILIILGIIALVAVTWVILARPKPNKIPSRGVFVYNLSEMSELNKSLEQRLNYS